MPTVGPLQGSSRIARCGAERIRFCRLRCVSWAHGSFGRAVENQQQIPRSGLVARKEIQMHRSVTGVLAGAVLAVAFAPSSVVAQEGETWETQQPAHIVTLIRIHPNMEERYLNNLRRAWLTGVKAQMEEGMVSDYGMYQTLTSNDDGYNLILTVTVPNLAAMDATEEMRRRVDAITKKVEEQIDEEELEEISGEIYPEIRTILSTEIVREIKFME
jgi:hypothetical protein